MSQRPEDATTTSPDSGGHLTEGLTRLATVGVVAGTMMALLLAALDQTIVGTAMPRIVAELNGLKSNSADRVAVCGHHQRIRTATG